MEYSLSTSEQNQNVPSVRLCVLYTMPLLYGTPDYATYVDRDTIIVCKDECWLNQYKPSDPELKELVQILMEIFCKVLSNDTDNILLTWYEHQLHYPDPTDEEVKELSEVTGVTEKQIKKWMANKHVRCFNTITGNKHPIKFKYEGREKKNIRRWRKMIHPALNPIRTVLMKIHAEF
ncbi:hypothetical protein CHS0354_034652 [Potamilus streckersoni]|uniref:KN homeodomain domain-containing protein n=1 Tax=Potamilus streckersoni TaxID=2493646 RepID=A0AAE0WA07_9BIVA|nr:hypothetical protein CHS0354_034652 [Potamilus streckersoni]